MAKTILTVTQSCMNRIKPGHSFGMFKLASSWVISEHSIGLKSSGDCIDANSSGEKVRDGTCLYGYDPAEAIIIRTGKWASVH